MVGRGVGDQFSTFHAFQLFCFGILADLDSASKSWKLVTYPITPALSQICGGDGVGD